MLKTRKTCRICGSKALTPVVNLGQQCLASNFALSPDFPPVTRKIPLELVRCNPELDEASCGFVQLRHTVSPDLMYSSYGYRSGVNDTMTRHLQVLATRLEEKINLGPGDLVVDIGANDGTLLLGYHMELASYVAFEPSDILPYGNADHLYYIKDYFSAAALTKYVRSKAKIITSIAMFYDLEEPNRFVADIANVLHEDGLWVVEVQYLPITLKKAAFDAICHEHLGYYSLSTLESLVSRHGLKIIDAEINESNGGSIRATISRKGGNHASTRPAQSRMFNLKKQEFEMGLDTHKPYLEFASNVDKIRNDLLSLITKLRRSGKSIYGYGASTKGNVILQYCGLGPEHITAIADRNPEKWGSSTPGSNIPIISEDEMRKSNPDYLLVLPWHFITEFRLRESEFLQRGGRFILPVPEVVISE